ncbi:MAG: ABC transporter ATP-binding protein [Candidatus Limnocylindrales bacterium]
MTESTPLLSVEGVSRSFGGVRAVRDCDLTVSEGTITGLIGPNGAGKSTLLELISGFKRPDVGRIRFAGKDITFLPAHRVSQLGLVRSFQTAREWPNLTVLENVLLPATSRLDETVWAAIFARRRLHVSERSARENGHVILEEFGLAELRNERAANLSGGQKRLLEFARIASASPRLILLDEPQTGVNPVMADKMAIAIQSLHRRGITVVMVEHNLGFVERLCDPVIVMALGTPIASGTMAELRRDPEVLDAYLGQANPTVEVASGV